MQKDYCKPGTGNTAVGEGGYRNRENAQTAAAPASQGQNEGALSFVGKSERS